MNLENLRDSWRAMQADDPTQQTECDRIAARVAAGRAQSSAQRLRCQWRLAILMSLLLPTILGRQLPQGDPQLLTVTCILLGLFIVSSLTHLLYLFRLLDRCDPVRNSLRETSQAVVRLRRTFLRSALIHMPLGLLLLGTLYLQQQTAPYHAWWSYGFWFGLAIGLPIGIHKFRRILHDIDGLAQALKELDE